MQKIMFNDRYALTQAVIEWRKNVTRRIEGGGRFQEMADCADEIFYNGDDGTLDMQYEGIDIFRYKPRYKVGEVVAVAQKYRTILGELNNPTNYCCAEHWEQGNQKRAEYAGEILSPGYGNKMYVRADKMPHQIRITAIRCERLQEISDADCLREGIFVNEYFGNGGKCHHYGFDGFFNGREGWFAKSWYDTPREAFAVLIDKVSGRGTWERNPWVVVYEFELVK